MEQPKLFVGVDLHLKTSQITVMDEQGNIKKKTRIPNHREFISEFFESLPSSSSISIEATYNWPWLVDLLEDRSFNPKLAHPKKVRLIAESTIKTDDIDSEALAHLDRLNFLPIAYIPSQEDRKARELLRYRLYLVKIRTALKNRIHASLAKLGIWHTFSDLFGKAGRQFLIDLEVHQAYKKPVVEQLELISLLDQKIIAITKVVVKEHLQENQSFHLVKTIPGFGDLSALLLAIEIGPISRFRTYKKLTRLAGLSSTLSQSGERKKYGHIDKNSNPFIRWILIEAVPKAIKKDLKLKAYYYKILKKKGKGKAKIAIARKLLIAIYFMLKNNQPYTVAHNIHKAAKQSYRLNPLLTLGAH